MADASIDAQTQGLGRHRLLQRLLGASRKFQQASDSAAQNAQKKKRDPEGHGAQAHHP
jgi:hypothetical protein